MGADTVCSAIDFLRTSSPPSPVPIDSHPPSRRLRPFVTRFCRAAMGAGAR